MFIVPYYIEAPVQLDFKLWKAWVFLANGGTHVWEESCTSKEAIADYLKPNGFTGKSRYDKKKDTLFMEISPTTDFSELYTWMEFLKEGKDIPKEFILRPLTWIGESPGLMDDWGWKDQCQEVSLGKFGTMADLWDGIA